MAVFLIHYLPVLQTLRNAGRIHTIFIYVYLASFRILYAIFWSGLVYISICEDGDKKRQNNDENNNQTTETKNEKWRSLVTNCFLSLPLFRPFSRLSYQLYLLHCVIYTCMTYPFNEDGQYHSFRFYVRICFFFFRNSLRIKNS